MNAMDIVRRLETYEISHALDMYADLSEDEAKDILQYLIDRKNGNKKVIRHQSGKDSFGKVGKAATTTIMSAGGAAGVMSTGVGGTILGSSTLGSLLGGILTVTTPIGWVLGGAAAAAALGYGVSKLVESGGKNDQIRSQNIRNAQSGETYNSRRTIEPMLFIKRSDIVGIVQKFKKLKSINKNSGAQSELEIEGMFDITTQRKITVASEATDRELHSEIVLYKEQYSEDIDVLSKFLVACVKHKLVHQAEVDGILAGVDSCDLLVDEFREYNNNLKEKVLVNLQVMLFKLAILADKNESDEEIGWYLASMQTKRVSERDALDLYATCPTDNINLRDVFLEVDDIFGQDIKRHLVNEVSHLLSVDGLVKAEYVFLKEVCNQSGVGKNHALAQYEKDNRLALIIDRAKSFFM